MVSKDAVIPIASFSAIVCVMLGFIAWWFPRQWNKGNAQERAIIDEEAAHLATLRAHQQQQQGVNRSAELDDASTEGGVDGKPPPYVEQQRLREYRPPVAGLG